eukprot:Tbor_TRINITY_DN3522_c0_g1::TRINITY_DN3522_c0_g1_i2::g.2933::m.2933
MDTEKQKDEVKTDVYYTYDRLRNILHLACHLMWLKLWTFIGNLKISFLYSEWSPQNRKIVIIGDDTAIGVGDWVTFGQEPGIQGRLNKIINKDVMSRIIGRGTLWSCFTYGKSGSTSGDWIPVSVVLPTQTTESETNGSVSSEKKLTSGVSLFDKAFNPCTGVHRDADIVVLIIGSKDRVTTTETVENIRKIALELLRLNKAVMLTTIPLPAFVLSNTEVMTRFRARTLALQNVFNEIQARDSPDGSFIKFSCEIEQGSSQPIAISSLAENLSNNLFYRFNGMVFNGKGYSKAAEVIYDNLVPMMRAIDGNKESRKNV